MKAAEEVARVRSEKRALLHPSSLFHPSLFRSFSLAMPGEQMADQIPEIKGGLPVEREKCVLIFQVF